MVPHIETDLSWGEFWTGLTNPYKVHCENGDCINKLKWESDGSYLNSWEDQNYGIIADSADSCLRYRTHRIDDKSCAMTYYYICEFKCSSTTTTRTTTTTTITSTTTTTTTSNTVTTTTAGTKGPFETV